MSEKVITVNSVITQNTDDQSENLSVTRLKIDGKPSTIPYVLVIVTEDGPVIAADTPDAETTFALAQLLGQLSLDIHRRLFTPAVPLDPVAEVTDPPVTSSS